MLFSASSRFRVIKSMASVDWKKAQPSLFITLTFPDEVRPTSPRQLSQFRSNFWRDVEKHLGRQAGCFWRVEWKQRQSGKLTGQMMPHLHLIVPNVRWIPYDTVNALWKKNIGSEVDVRTETKRIKNPDMAAAYVCKYIGKLDCSLVNASYLISQTFGRSWGICRKQLIPWFPRDEIQLKKTDGLRLLRKFAVKGRGPAEEDESMSFTLIGTRAQEVAKVLRRWGLTTANE